MGGRSSRGIDCGAITSVFPLLKSICVIGRFSYVLLNVSASLRAYLVNLMAALMSPVLFLEAELSDID